MARRLFGEKRRRCKGGGGSDGVGGGRKMSAYAVSAVGRDDEVWMPTLDSALRHIDEAK